MLRRSSFRREAWGEVFYSFEDDAFYAVTTGTEIIPSAPLGVGWVIIGGCNLRCGHCYGNEEALPRPHLRGDSVLRVADALIEADVMRVVISGGEPLLHPDIEKVINRLSNHGVSVVLGTNGTFLTPERADRLAVCTRVEVSLDGDSQSLNNQLRPSRERTGNAFEETRRAIRICRQHGLRLRVLTSVSRFNQARIPQMADLLSNWGVTDWALSWTLPAGRALPVYSEYRPIEAVVRDGVEKARRMHPEMTIRSSNRSSEHDRYYCLVLPDGTVATEAMGEGGKVVFGSLLSTPLRSFWTKNNFNIPAHVEKWIGDRIFTRGAVASAA
jgi:MoaA/NifB/PqqE/SkfB family radical SAM enzyme